MYLAEVPKSVPFSASMAVKLHEAGHFTWPEWAATLSAEINAARERGDPDLGNTYYSHWLAALERLVTEKKIFSSADLTARKEAWGTAYDSTPHGLPVKLPSET